MSLKNPKGPINLIRQLVLGGSTNETQILYPTYPVYDFISGFE